MENKKEMPLDYELAKQKLRQQFRSGKSLFSKGGAFAPLLQEMLNSMLEGEMEAHLDEEQRSVGNRRNGKSSKLLKTSAGTSLKYVASKDQKLFMADLKLVYRADNEQIALDELEKLKEKWNKKYGMVISSWQNNWAKLATYFKYPAGIRKLIYTTNTIEGYHRQIRKVTKNKGVFTSDMALLKLIYLATERIQQKWTMPLNN